MPVAPSPAARARAARPGRTGGLFAAGNLALTLAARARGSVRPRQLLRQAVAASIWSERLPIQLDCLHLRDAVGQLAVNRARTKVAVVLGKAHHKACQLTTAPPSPETAGGGGGFVMSNIAEITYQHPVTAVRWSPTDDDRHAVLTLGGRGLGGALRIYSTRDDMWESVSETYGLTLQRRDCWTCEWSPDGTRIAIGSGGAVLIADPARQGADPAMIAVGGKSDVFALAYQDRGAGPLCGCLLAGCRNGSTYLVDPRSKVVQRQSPALTARSVRHVSTQPSPAVSSIGSLLALDDGTAIMATMSGAISRWDLRSQGVVATYTGQVNSRTMVPLSMDVSTGTLCAGGEDGTVRLWDVGRAGAPYTSRKLADQPMPACLAATGWPGVRGQLGILVGHARGQLELFSV